MVEGSSDNLAGPIECGEVICGGDGMTPCFVDLAYDRVGAPNTVVHTDVAHDNLRALLGHEERLGSADPLPAAGDDRHRRAAG